MLESFVAVVITVYLIGCAFSAVCLYGAHETLRDRMLNTKYSLNQETAKACREDYEALFGLENLPATLAYYVGLSWYGVYQQYKY